MPRTYTLQTKSEVKKLFCAGWTFGQLATKFGISKGTLACWAARGQWSRERVEDKQPLDVLQNGQITDLEGVTIAQRYRQGIWPSDAPGGLRITFDAETATAEASGPTTLVLHFDHDRERLATAHQVESEPPPPPEGDPEY